MGEFDQTVDLPELRFQKLNIGPYSNNVYILTCKQTKECVIVDTSFSADPILAACEGATPKYILQTHCHGDHIDAFDEVDGGVETLFDVYCPKCGHEWEVDLPLDLQRMFSPKRRARRRKKEGTTLHAGPGLETPPV